MNHFLFVRLTLKLVLSFIYLLKIFTLILMPLFLSDVRLHLFIYFPHKEEEEQEYVTLRLLMILANFSAYFYLMRFLRNCYGYIIIHLIAVRGIVILQAEKSDNVNMSPL